jgi:sugar phosphate isomerase/epimerase
MRWNDDGQMTRRQMLALAGSAAALTLSAPVASLVAQAPTTAPVLTSGAPPRPKRFKVAGDDLFLNNRRQNPQAFSIAAKAGLDGVVVDMGSMVSPPDANANQTSAERVRGKSLSNKLRDPALRQTYFKASRDTGLEIAALGFFALYAWVYPDLPVAVQMGEEWVDMLVKMDCKLGFMPLTPGPAALADKSHQDVWKRTVEVFKKFTPAAEKAGVVLGIELNHLDADGYKRCLDEIGSPAVKAYYNPGRALESKLDAYKDIRALGKDRICALHLEQGSVPPEDFERRLGDGLIDFKKLREAIMEIEWGGWMSIARSRLKGTTSADTNMSANGKFVHDLFPE